MTYDPGDPDGLGPDPTAGHTFRAGADNPTTYDPSYLADVGRNLATSLQAAVEVGMVSARQQAALLSSARQRYVELTSPAEASRTPVTWKNGLPVIPEGTVLT